MLKKITLSAFCLLIVLFSKINAQNVGIGTPTPQSSAKLHIESTNSGLLIPRVSLLATSNGISPVNAPVTGVLVYNTNAAITSGQGTGFYFWNGAIWEKLGFEGNEWKITGNSGTVDGINFIGTTDATPFNIRVNNQKAGRIEFTVGTAGTFLGYEAGNINSGARNTALGYTALSTNSTATDNTAIGANALRLNTGGQNTAVGSLAMQNNSTGYRNTSLGYQSLLNNTTGYGNTSVGYNAARAGISGIYNTALGTQALESNTTGSNNTALGYLALFSNTASSNLAIGASALRVNTTASNNIAIGHNSLDANTTGTPNLAIGVDALGANTTGANNVAIGHNALLLNTASNNVAVGPRAMDANTTGTPNLAIGADALGVNVIGVDNIAIGVNTLAANIASNNIAIGPRALDVNTTGNVNTAMGQDALGANTSGGSNVAIGYRTLFNNTISTANTAIGRSAGDGFAHANNNTFIGAFSDAGVAGLTNSTAIGANAIVSAPNAMVLGNNVNVGIGINAPVEKLHVVGTRTLVQNGSDAIHSSYNTNSGFRFELIGSYPGFDNRAIYLGGYNVNVPGGGGYSDANKIYCGGPFGSLAIYATDFVNVSSGKLKQNISSMSYGLTEIMKINPVRYQYTFDKSGVYQLGFIAEEMAEVVPELVAFHDEENNVVSKGKAMGIDYSKMSAVLVKAVQEQQAQIQSQQSIIESQKKELDELKSRMDRLEKLIENK